MKGVFHAKDFQLLYYLLCSESSPGPSRIVQNLRVTYNSRIIVLSLLLLRDRLHVLYYTVLQFYSPKKHSGIITKYNSHYPCLICNDLRLDTRIGRKR